jgi:imidazolonepropionase-like amidohydrolase
MSLVVTGATIIDAVSDKPIEGQAILVEDGRIKAIGRRDELPVPADAEVIDAAGKFVIPGLMNANVHLCGCIMLETLVRYEDRYEDLIIEAAQVALKAGQTTVFDTWGPRRHLMNARDMIDRGEATGARIRCAGNIMGFDGPFSPDFFGAAAQIATPNLVKRINATWVENTGRHLMWLTPQQLGEEVRRYIENGIDFVKYGATEHGAQAAGAFICFSERAQRAIVEEAHRAGITAQSHSSSVEGLHLSITAGCDLVTHCNMTGPVAIPDDTLDLFARSGSGAVIFPVTEKGLEWLKKGVTDFEWTLWAAADTNARNLVKSGAKILLANDAAILSAEVLASPQFGSSWMGMPQGEALGRLDTGHFFWFRAMEEKGMAPMEMLRAATRNIAEAYKVDDELGTLEPGKAADMVILDKDPLASARNYETIHAVIKGGKKANLDRLPEQALLTRPLAAPAPEEAAFKPFLHEGVRMPACPSCITGRH